MFGDVLHHDRVAQVRLVAAVFAQGFRKGNPRPVLCHRLALGKFLEHARDHRLHRREDIVLLDKAHLEVELIELARQTVGARVLVAETRRDLEVAVEARHHQQLLVLLRRLRQRVEFSGMDPRRHQKVPRAFRRGRRQDRGLEFEEALLLHPLAHGIDDRAAGHDVLVQLLATEVEEAVLKPYVFRIFLLAEHRQRQFGGRPQHLDLADIDFDHAGRQFRIVGAVGAAAHLAVDPHHPFRAQLLGFLERRRIRVGHALGQAVMVAQIDEQHAAMVADTMAPARKAGGLRRCRSRGARRMYVTGSDAWNSQKLMSEGRIGGKSPSEGAEGLPDAVVSGNQWRGLFCAPGATFPAPARPKRLPIPQPRLSWGHDGPFPVPEHLCGAAGELFRPRRPDPGRRPAADQAEPGAGGPARPRSGPA